MPIELLNPKNDYVFKRIFGHIGNENITKQMLSTILKRTIDKISLNENPILEKDLLDDKIGIVDIHAKIDETIDVDIEMQVVEQKDIEKRILFYWSKMYSKGIGSGDNYSKLQKTIAILISNFELSKLKRIPEFYTKWQIREEKYTSVILTDMLELYILEIPKAVKIKESVEKEIKPWLDFLENPKDMEMVGMSNKNEIAIKEAKKVLEKISEDEHERYLAELREKYIRDQKAIEAFGYDSGLEDGLKKGIEQGLQDGLRRGVEQGLQDGLRRGVEQGLQDGLKRGIEQGLQDGLRRGVEQGLQDGLKRGIEQGLQDGLKKGMEQGLQDGLKQRTLEIAKEMLKQNFTIEAINSVTGLTKEEIEKLK